MEELNIEVLNDLSIFLFGSQRLDKKRNEMKELLQLNARRVHLVRRSQPLPVFKCCVNVKIDRQQTVFDV